MSISAQAQPVTDPTVLFEIFRGNHGTELLTAAVHHFRIFDRLVGGVRSQQEIGHDLGLASRPLSVLLTALRAFGLIVDVPGGGIDLTPLSREHLVSGAPFDVGGYISLAADSPGVVEMVERL